MLTTREEWIHASVQSLFFFLSHILFANSHHNTEAHPSFTCIACISKSGLLALLEQASRAMHRSHRSLLPTCRCRSVATFFHAYYVESSDNTSPSGYNAAVKQIHRSIYKPWPLQRTTLTSVEMPFAECRCIDIPCKCENVCEIAAISYLR